MSYSRSLEQDLGIQVQHCRQAITLAQQCLLMRQEGKGDLDCTLEGANEILFCLGGFLVHRNLFIRKLSQRTVCLTNAYVVSTVGKVHVN